ncbi:MAG: peptidyl-prolyl cis-trans isomerase [Rhodocyclaceae bacterium]|nr:peptidyl-prolyl cis-trans isomerase [Rhodocyclaceae bacterium]
MKSHLNVFALTIALASGLCLQANPASAQQAAAHGRAAAQLPSRFAVVEGVEISGEQYLAALNEAVRNKFYHGQPPEAEVTKVRRSVGYRLINDILLEREAAKLGVAPDMASVDEQIASYEARYKDSAAWQERRETVLPQLRAKLARDTIRTRMESRIKTLPEPTRAEVKSYYEKHPDKFTEPEQVRLAMILLKVDPSSTSETWQAARDEGNKLVEKIKGGAKFADLAVLQSADVSAEKGGDLGYIHRGMVPEDLSKQLDDLKINDVSEPIRILEGVAVFQLLGRKPSTHHTLERVYDRASDLYARDRAERAWENYLEKLPTRYSVEINTQDFPAFKAENG